MRALAKFWFLFAALLGAPAPVLANEPICVFAIGGQSPASGYGNMALSVAPPIGVLNYKNGAIIPAADPLCDACQGSPWPAFGSELYNLTGRKVLFVQTALNGGIQTAAYGNYTNLPHWDEGGTLVPLAFGLFDAAIAAAEAAGYWPKPCGVAWIQGEAEGSARVLVPDVVDVPDYITAHVNMKRRFRDRYGETLPFFIFKTGSLMAGSLADNRYWEPGFAQIRAAQERMAKDDSRTAIVSRLALQFAARGQLDAQYGIHPTQDANNLWGIDGARHAAASGLIPAFDGE